jgi:hypothetical protein
MMFAIGSLRDVTGVNLELLGQADREQAASLEMQRRQSAMTILATLFNSLRRYRKEQGKLMLQFIWLLPDNTMIRINEKGNYKYIPLTKDHSIEKYDVIVDEAPSSPNQKQAVWAMISQLLQTTQLPPEAIIKLLKYSPLPESVVSEIEAAMGLGATKSPEQLQQQLAQAEQALQVLEQKLQEQMAEAKTAEDDRSIDILKTEIEEYKAETMRLSAMWTNQVAMQKASADAAATPDPSESGDATPASQVGGNEEVLTQLGMKLEALTQMFVQFVQASQGGEAEEAPLPPQDVQQGEL